MIQNNTETELYYFKSTKKLIIGELKGISHTVSAYSAIDVVYIIDSIEGNAILQYLQTDSVIKIPINCRINCPITAYTCYSKKLNQIVVVLPNTIIPMQDVTNPIYFEVIANTVVEYTAVANRKDASIIDYNMDVIIEHYGLIDYDLTHNLSAN